MNIKITTANEHENSSKESKKNPAPEYSTEAYEKALKIAGERAENQRLEIKALKEKIEDLQTILRNQTEQNDSLKQRYEAACVANLELQKEVIKMHHCEQTRRAEATSANEDPCADCDERDDCCADEENADEFTIEAIEAEAIEPALAVSELQGEVDALKYCFDSMLRWLLGTSDQKEQKD